MDKLESGCFGEIICTKTPHCLAFFNQSEQGPVLLCYACENNVSLSVLHFPSLEDDIEEFSYENLTDINHIVQPVQLSWSPKTSMTNHPVGIIFCAAGADFNIYVFTVDNKMSVSIKTIGEHTGFVNDLSYEPIHGKELASVGDDKKCRIWDAEDGGQVTCIPLTSPGKNVCWNQNDLGKLMIAEENGCIRMYETANYLPIFSLQCITPKASLMSADWSINNPFKVGAVIGKQWFVWDTRQGSLPVASGQAHAGCSNSFKWSLMSDAIFATRGRPDSQTKIYMLNENKIITSFVTKIGEGISWHNLLPVFAVSANRRILLFDLESCG